MGGYSTPQQIVVQTVKDSPTYVKVMLSIIPVIVAFVLGKIFTKKKK